MHLLPFLRSFLKDWLLLTRLAPCRSDTEPYFSLFIICKRREGAAGKGRDRESPLKGASEPSSELNSRCLRVEVEFLMSYIASFQSSWGMKPSLKLTGCFDPAVCCDLFLINVEFDLFIHVNTPLLLKHTHMLWSLNLTLLQHNLTALTDQMWWLPKYSRLQKNCVPELRVWEHTPAFGEKD